VLELQIEHRPQAEIPTETDGTAVEDTERTSTASGTRPRPQPQRGSGDETLVMSAPAPTPARPAEPDTLEMPSPVPAVPPPVPTPATAKTVIMDISQTRREGLLMVESDPPGATVFLDGVRAGSAPISDLQVKFGAHELRLEAPGWEPALLQIELRPERPLRALTVSLAPARAKDGSIRPGQFTAFGPEVLAPCRVAGALPTYPPGARERGLAGSATVEVWIGEKGEVMDLAIVESAGAILDGALLDAVSQWRFTPARVRGVPVSVRLTVQHHFRP
jgi:TonB family protein